MAKAKKSFKVKKYDEQDFSKLLDKPLEEFAVKMHKRLVTATKVMKRGDDENVDGHAIKRCLADFPSMYSWAIVEHRLIKAAYEEKVEKVKNRMKVLMDSREKDKHTTAKKFEAELYVEHKDEIDEMEEEKRELSAKYDLAKDMVNVWATSIHSLQSLSKQVSAELDLARVRHRHGS